MRRRVALTAALTAAPLMLLASYAGAATTTTVDLSCSGASLGDHVTVSARLRDADGQQLGGESLTVVRDDEFDAPTPLTGRIRTDAVTAATIADQPPNRGLVTYTASYAGKGTLAPSTGSCTTDVIGSGTQLDVYPDGPTTAGDPLGVRGELRTAAGDLLSGPLSVSVDGVEAATATTSGLFHIELPSPAVGEHQVAVRYAGDRVQEDAEAVAIRLVRQPTVLTIDGPDRLPTADGADFVITLTTTDGTPVPDVVVDAPGDGDWGSTDAAGQIHVHRLVHARDPLILTASYWPSPSQQDEQLYAPSTASRTWRGVPEFSFWSSQPRYTYGQTGDFSVGQVLTSSTYPPQSVATYTPYGQATQTLPQTTTADPYTFSRTLTRNAVVRISVRADSLFEAGSASFRIAVAPRLTQDVRGEWGRDGATWLVRRWVDPVVSLTTRPLRAGTCAYLRVQKYADGAWRARSRTGCRTLDSTSSTSARISGDFTAGTRLRARWETPSDALNAAGTGAWQVIRFTR